MDTITQAVLGAAVGEATLGKKVGNKAPLWGAVAGVIPDLDIIPGHFMDAVSRLDFHRGFSHSLIFALILAPAAAWLIARIHKKENIDWKPWTLLFFLGMSTHYLLDCFTTWGTQVFWPLNYRIAWNTVYVIDPLYSIPFAVFLVLAMLQKRKSRKRRIFTWLGIGISSLYLMVTVINKQFAESAFKQAAVQKHIEYIRINTRPTPFNSILWTGVIETQNGFYEGLYSLFDPDKDIHLEYFKKNHQLISRFRGNPELEKLIRLCKGFYTIRPAGEDLLLQDFRYGRAAGWMPNQRKDDFIFQYLISAEANRNNSANLRITREPGEHNINKKTFILLWQRIRGIRTTLNN
jgi:inner membrane protein